MVACRHVRNGIEGRSKESPRSNEGQCGIYNGLVLCRNYVSSLEPIMSTAHQTNNIHPNSLQAFSELDLPQSEDRVFQVYKRIRKGLTDRDVLFYLTRKRRGDMNIVRPRATAMINRLGSPLVEIGKTECKTTGRRVRVVMYQGKA